MVRLRTAKAAPLVTAIAGACGALVFAAHSANAANALFRAKRTWWFTNVDSWTSGYVWPRSDAKGYQPPAIAYVGKTAINPMFTAPKSFIKNTTDYFACNRPPYDSDHTCFYPTHYQTKAWYSYWNAKGSFRPQNPYAPTTTTTIRFATTMSNPNPTPRSPHTAMYDPVTPTTTWGGRYDHSRAGSIMIWPGKNRFGGTMRFFDGPNDRFYKFFDEWWHWWLSWSYTATIRPVALSQQIGTGVEIEIGEVTEASVAFHYEVTFDFHRRVVIGTTSMGGPEYNKRTVRYLVTNAPYTTGKARVWEPIGNTNTIQSATGYDNRSAAGLNGTISLVHPRLVHAYTVYPPSSGKPIRMTWSSARMRKIDFRFLPEPGGAVLLTAGLVVLAGLSARRAQRLATRRPW